MEMHAYYLVLSDLCCAPHASSYLVKVYKARNDISYLEFTFPFDVVQIKNPLSI